MEARRIPQPGGCTERQYLGNSKNPVAQTYVLAKICGLSPLLCDSKTYGAVQCGIFEFRWKAVPTDRPL